MSITKKRRVKSRRKLTQEQALSMISNLMMEYQSEKEMQLALNKPIDKTMKLILSLAGIEDVEQAKRQNEENLNFIQWKIYEDLGRYVEPGIYKLDAHPYFFTKLEEMTRE